MDTQFYDGFDCVDYELTDAMQMVGLTGRSVDDIGKCVIMCH